LDNEQFTADSQHAARPIEPRRHAAFFAMSIACHAALIAALVLLVPAIQRPHHDWVLAYLVDSGNGGAGASGGGHAHSLSDAPRAHRAADSLASREASAALRKIQKHSRRVAPPVVAATAAESASVAPVATAAPAATKRDANLSPASVQTGSGAVLSASIGGAGGTGMDHVGIGTGSAGNGSGDGNPGDSLAHAGYGDDPPPPYPADSRREGEQGTVTLHVLVAQDGAVERVEIEESSGFDALDDAAVATVRERWRFVPARRDGTPTESWVLVPIRFALTEASANE
jgi:periplasmic protein TonB